MADKLPTVVQNMEIRVGSTVYYPKTTIEQVEGGVKHVYLTQSEYNSLKSKDPDTLYFITGTIEPGPQGLQGIRGAQGVKGDRGFDGVGSNGAQGARGAQGVAGNNGLSITGSQGMRGAQGARGDKGDNGSSITGPQGVRGSQGPKGDRGNDGSSITGPQGVQGARGATGTGTNGNQGARGAQGVKGDIGPTPSTSNFVTTNTQQSITARKTFKCPFQIDGTDVLDSTITAAIGNYANSGLSLSADHKFLKLTSNQDNPSTTNNLTGTLICRDYTLLRGLFLWTGSHSYIQTGSGTSDTWNGNLYIQPYGNSAYYKNSEIATLGLQQTWTAYQNFTAGAGNSGSDIRFKTNIKPTQSVLDDVLKLDVIDYIWDKEGEEKRDTFGISAQQLEELGGNFKKMVHDRGDENKTKWVEYDRFGVLALKAIQELCDKIEKQDEEIKYLKSQILTKQP